jgi:hypothetical protein
MPGILGSWKEIAAYTKKSIRTLQRWERTLGFPIRRPNVSNASIVFAFASEIDDWFAEQSGSGAKSRVGVLQERIKNLELEIISLRAELSRTHTPVVRLQPRAENARRLASIRNLAA